MLPRYTERVGNNSFGSATTGVVAFLRLDFPAHGIAQYQGAMHIAVSHLFGRF
jgi:hypothetical protein